MRSAEAGVDAPAPPVRPRGVRARLLAWWRRPSRLELQPLDLTAGRTVVQAWVGSRGLIALVALLLAVFTDRDVLQLLNNWDAVHFGDLARYGYGADPDGKLAAFF